MYSYALNNPLRFTDPSGAFSVEGAFKWLFGIQTAQAPGGENYVAPQNTETPWDTGGPISTVAEMSDANDVAILTTGSSLNGKKADETDIAFAEAGVAIPVVSGSLVKKILKKAGKLAENIVKTGDDIAKLEKKLASEAQMANDGKKIINPEKLRDGDRLAKQYGGNKENWVKMTSPEYTARDGTKFQTHWFENTQTGQKVESKTKFN